MEQKLVKNPSWQEDNQWAIYKAWGSWIRDHQTQTHLVGGRRIWTRDLRIISPGPLPLGHADNAAFWFTYYSNG